ncbi:hypothetical protein [Acidicapsa acidisoli]|uniref:hypothetical protein n=1 Tax=Acidicapsa acidisoli TaxID=1615681 RepID=UPI0021DF4C34|nr:hypothetical protein [Acidicapsa acidisoli]
MEDAVLYALTREGVKLPVIDVTHPAFALSTSDAELAALSKQYVFESMQAGEISAPLREALKRSKFGSALMAASGSFLPGMATYLLKLGPDNLAADTSPIDRRIAASFPAFTTRLRLQDMANLLADGILRLRFDEHRIDQSGRALHLINIGGGVAADSWNALLCLHARDSALLASLEIVITVLDIDTEGPAFAHRAIEALCGRRAPLSGLSVAFQHFEFEWSRVGRLRQVLEDLRATSAVCAVSSEGGLFEYGSDGEIVSILAAVHEGTAADAFLVGSVTRDGDVVRVSQRTNGIATRPRTLEAFQSLVKEAGWVVQRVIERPFSYNVRMEKA